MFKLNKITAGMALAGSVAAISALPSIAFAEEALSLEEVTVTARKRAESLQDVPVTVTAITGQLQNSAVKNLKDLQNFVPNVSIDSTPASSAASISIRGISFQEPDKSLDPPVGVILDGVYLGTASGQLMDSFDLERVEVLRGPQGTLFGKNTIAGAINVIRTAPTKELGIKAKVGGGSFGLKEAKAVINAPLGESGGLKVYANKTDSDGYMQNNIVGRKIGGKDFEQVGATVAFDVTENFDIALTVETIEDNSEMGAWSNFNDATAVPCLLSGGFVCLGTDPESGEDNSSTNTPNTASVDNDFASLTMNWTVNDWQLTSITGHVERKEVFDIEYDSSSVEFLNVSGSSDYKQFSQEFRIDGSVNENINLTAGLYYWDSEFRQDQTSHDMWFYIPIDLGFGAGSEFMFGAQGMSPINVPGFSFPGWGPLAPGDVTQTLNNSGTNTATAAFASVDWQISDSLIANLGGRYTQEKKTFSAANAGWVSASQPLVNAFFADGPVQNYSDTWKEFSPRAALQYNISDDVMAFASYSRGFKSGGYFARSTQVDGNSYDPETVETWEAGIKSELFDNRVRLNVTAFMSDYKDKQEEVIIQTQSSANTVVRNASNVELSGLELELAAVVTSKINMYLNVGTLDSNYKNFIADINGDGMVTDNSGLKLRNAPETTIAIGGDFVQPTDFGEFALRYSYRWADEYQTVFNNHALGKVRAIGTHNASMDLAIGENYKLSVYGRNLTDERYARVVIIPGFTHFGQYNAPRHFGAELTVNF